MTDEEFRDKMRGRCRSTAASELREDVWSELAGGMHYVATEFTSEGGERRGRRAPAELDATRGTQGNRVYYLAIPPTAMEPTVEQIGRARGRRRAGRA